MFTLSPFATLVILVVLFYLFWSLRNVGRRPPGLPPGPPTLPILGNLHQMPTKDAHVQFKLWAEQYGSVYSLMLGTRPTIVLSSDIAVKDLLDKRGGQYSDRPNLFISQTVASGGFRLVIMYGDAWRTIHRLLHNILNINVAAKYIPYQDLESVFLLKDLLNLADIQFSQLRRFSYSLSTQLIFGFRCHRFDDPMLEKLFYTVEEWGKISSNGLAQLADMYPVLQKLPRLLLPAVRKAEHVHEVGSKLYTGHWLRAKKALQGGTAKPCICTDLLLAQQSEELSDLAVGYIVGSLLEGGSDTTASTLYGFLQAMIAFPDVQKKAQAEIDRAVGGKRLPNMDDYAQLPYIKCCIKETLRWMPTVILGVPHRAMKDDTYQGWKIPKGSTVINNVWAIHMDSKRSPNPREFKPERFIDDHTTLYESANGEPLLRDNFNFGAGRRLCQGIHIAERSLFLCMTRILWSLDLKAPLDKDNNPIVPDIDRLVGGITVHPRPFKVVMNPRSPERAEIVQSTIKSCEALLDNEGQWKKTPEGVVFGAWKPTQARQ